MIYGIGTDICRIERVALSLQRFGGRFAERILGTSELQEYDRRNSKNPKRGLLYLATRFAGKEAFSKAVGLGIRMPMTWKNCEILKKSSGQPYLELHGELREWFDAKRLSAHISITDEQEYALAFVVVEMNK